METSRWETLTFAEQMGNIGSEVGRVASWHGKDDQKFESAFARAHDLIQRSLQDPRRVGRRKELARSLELLNTAVEDPVRYGYTLRDLEAYFYPFALKSRSHL